MYLSAYFFRIIFVDFIISFCQFVCRFYKCAPAIDLKSYGKMLYFDSIVLEFIYYLSFVGIDNFMLIHSYRHALIYAYIDM